jgi:glutathione S-transferase
MPNPLQGLPLLYIGNKNYSSWSLRAWLLLAQAGIPFEEVRLRLEFEPQSAFKRALVGITPTGRVPVLVDHGFAVWDTLAIAEYVAERFPEKCLWPRDVKQRARARSLCSEMHGGFAALRSHFPMNIEADLPEIGARVLADVPEARADVARIEQMWAAQLAESGGPFLFGSFTIADAFYAPVCSRLKSYAVSGSAITGAYARHILSLPAMQRWTDAALAEHDFLEADEPYRRRP